MRNIKQFLPPRFQTNPIANFMESTTDTLFSEKNATKSTYFVGKTPSGIFNPEKDYYLSEIRKIREDYQLEPSLVISDPTTGEPTKILPYEDMINALVGYGVDMSDHKRVFDNDSYSFAPPIDIDMFINSRDYYWYPEGIPAIRVTDLYVDIVGKSTKEVQVSETGEALSLTTGMHIIVEDREYIVGGVGRYITLEEFDLDNNLPTRVPLVEIDSNDSFTTLDLFPKEYITMTRGSKDRNPWSRNNAWYHKDAITFKIGSVKFKPSNDRRANRPIIAFEKDIVLANYPEDHFMNVDLYGLTGSAVDNVQVSEGMTVLEQDTPNIYTMQSGSLVHTHTLSEGQKVTIINGEDNKGQEYFVKDGVLTLAQLKTSATQAIEFWSSNGSNQIFGYDVDNDNGVFDTELRLNIKYKSNGSGSDIVFRNFMTDPLEVYKKNNHNDVSNNILKFTVDNYEGNKSIYVNGDSLPTLVLYANKEYLFDFSDSSTTPKSIFEEYTQISIVDRNGSAIIKATTAHNKINKITQTFEYFTDLSRNKYRYTDGTLSGDIIVIENNNSIEEYFTNWRKSTKEQPSLYHREVIDGSTLTLEYNPMSDADITVKYDGEETTAYTRNIKELVFDDIENEFVEVTYKTNDTITSTEKTVQNVHTALSNNAYNDDVLVFSYSEIFNHFISIIRNQPYLEGTPLSNNNYRDTIKDVSLGDVIIKHDVSMATLQFMLSDDRYNFFNALKLTEATYSNYKSNLTTYTEDFMRDYDINVTNVHDVFDEIMGLMNNSKTKSDAYNNTYMFGTFKKFINLTLDDTGYIVDGTVVDAYNNTLYVYTDNGIQNIGVDFDVENNTIIPKTFSLSDISFIRYYEEMEPSFCPATPSKLGLSPVFVPSIQKDDTFLKDVYFIIGHDGSRTLAYASNEDIEAGLLDPRDLMLLEFEKRIYNTIERSIKESEVVFSIEELRQGKFRDTRYSKKEVRDLEYKAFHAWVLENNMSFETNNSYVSNDPFTYNYALNKDQDGEVLDGSWKAIYMYYYDTYRPHTNPWEMLGFKNKPEWFDDEYGTDYSTNNTYLWYDLEQGIIRQGGRQNTNNEAYFKDNPYRRIGLSNVIPVDENGELKDPISIGITTKPDYFSGKNKWKFGDYSPVELAWRNSSDYKFTEQRIKFVLNPLEYVTRTWDVHHSIENEIVSPRELQIHNTDYVAGISQWIADYLRFNRINVEDAFVTPFNNQSINLSYKVGGFVDQSELTVSSESFSPNNSNSSNIIPHEDVTVLTHESKDFKQLTYSGVIIERVSEETEIKPFIEGVNYDNGDVVVNLNDNVFYQYINEETIPTWRSSTYYIQGRQVEYNGVVYVCNEPHRSVNTEKPDTNTLWNIKPFIPTEWKMLPKRPMSKSTVFKVSGFDPYNTSFTTLKSDPQGEYQTITSTTRQSKVIPVTTYSVGLSVKKGQHILMPNGKRVSAKEDLVLDESFDSKMYNVVSADDVFAYTTSTTVKIKPDTNNGYVYQSVPYGSQFKTIDEVSQFLVEYGLFLEHRGWIFDNRNGKDLEDWMGSIKEFIQWEFESREEGSAIFLSPAANGIKFKSNHGVASIKRDNDQGNISLMNDKGQVIDFEHTEALRIDNTLTLKAEEPIYFCRIDLREYEHIITTSNVTIFNDVIYNPVLNIRKDRLRITAMRSNEWDGRLRADGFIIVGDKVIPNFDTSIADINSIMDVESVSTQDALNSLKYHNIGFQPRSYLSELEMDDTTQVKFYKGFIRNKGTSESYQRLLRTDALGSNIDLSISEEWAFKEGEFGGVTNNQSVEFVLAETDVKSTPQNIYLEYFDYTFDNKKSSIVYVDVQDSDKWIKKPSLYSDNGLFNTKPLSDVKKLPSAGYVDPDSVDVLAYNIFNINSQIKSLDATISDNSTIWIADNEVTKNGWDVLVVQPTTLTIGEIVTNGVDGKSSFVMEITGTVVPDQIYGIYTNDDTHTFTLKPINSDDGKNYYIALSTDDTYNILSGTPTVIYELKSTRTKESNVVDLTTINNKIVESGIQVFNGLRIFVDNTATGGWKVYEYSNSSWTVVNKEREVINSDMISEVLVYDKESNIVLNNLNIHDPLKGIFAGSTSNYIDWMTPYDPAVYNDETGYSNWAKDYVGKLWLDTSKIRYIEYENGDPEFRSKFWGNLFPNSSIDIYEWTKTSTKPESGKYVTFKEFNSKTGIENTFYYHWVKNPPQAPSNSARKVSAVDIANSIRYPENNGVPFIIITGNESMAIYDVNNTISQKEVVLQINYQLDSTDNKPHSQWKLVAEADHNDEIPEFLFDKMMDSIIGYDDEGRMVPDPSLSEVQKYGNKNQPRQSWFKNTKEARRIFIENMNAVLIDLNIWDINLFWERLDENGIERETDVYGLVDWYDPSFSPNTTITNLVNTRAEMLTTNLADGEIVKVQERIGRQPTVYERSWTVYRYLKDANTYQKVAEQDAAIQFKEYLADIDMTVEMAVELRKMIKIIFENFLIGEHKRKINELFFSLVRYVFVEQPANDWVFPTTYISVLQTSNQMIKIPTYQRNKEDQLVDFITEAKPFHTKLRSYNHVQTAPPEYVGLHVTDFDKPPYITDNASVLPLHEKVISKTEVVDGVRTYTLENNHDVKTTVVYLDGQRLPNTAYDFTGKTITFFDDQTLARNNVKNIVVESLDPAHYAIIQEYDQTRGYNYAMGVSLDEWKGLVNQKHITVVYDRISDRETMPLERVKELYDGSTTEDTPLHAFTRLSDKTRSEPFTEFERCLCIYFYDQLESVINASTVITINSKKNNVTGMNIDKTNVELLIDNKVIHPDDYNVSKSGSNVNVQTLMPMYKDQVVTIRPKQEYQDLLNAVRDMIGVVSSHYVKATPMLNGITLDQQNNIILANINDIDGVIADNIANDPESINDYYVVTDQGQPEEYAGMTLNESMTFTFNNNLNVVNRGYDTVGNLPIFDTIKYTHNGGSEVPITLGSCNPDQLLVIINKDEWSLDMQYEVYSDKIVWIKNPPIGKPVIITDRMAAFDPYMGRYVKHVNIEGFDGNAILPDSYNDNDDWREVIIYDSGRVINMKSPESIDIDFNITKDQLTLPVTSSLFDDVSDTNQRIVMIRGERSEYRNGKKVVLESIIEYIRVNKYDGNEITFIRGLFGQYSKDFDSALFDIKLHPMQIANTMDSFTITEPFIGINGKNMYPKYGRIITGKD